MERLFEFLFKYRPLVFEQGDFAFGAAPTTRVWLLVAGVAGAALATTYMMARGNTRPSERAVLAGLRILLLATLVFCLMQPTLLLSTVVPQQNFVGVLIDDSRSMQLTDQSGSPRSRFVADAFTPGESELLAGLSERFVLRFYRFSTQAGRVNGPAGLTYDGTHTNLASALDAAREDLAGVPVAGLVMVTDGADNGGRPLTEALVPLQAAGVPVFTVGLGEEAMSPDIELGRVEMPRAVLQGSSLLVDVVVSQVGFGRRTVPVIVEEDHQILAQEDVELGPEGEPVVARVHFRLEDPGPRRVTFRIPTQEGERVERNNERTLQIEVRGAREKILYFEGEPRFEVKFLRRAVEDDENLQVVLLQRTAESKFLRLAVDDSTELEFGFPTTREELYTYRGLIIGSTEASFFTHDQLQMIADFVSERGGGLLFLGGGRSFAEGGWAGTPVEEVLPVVLGEPQGGPDGFFAEVAVTPTQAGRTHPAVQLGEVGDDNEELWSALPAVTTVNPISGVRAGATALLTGSSPDLARDQVVLAHQRYGRGKALALTVQDSWLWQMIPPLEDLSHETFWKQLLRWLVDGVPDPVMAVTDVERVEPGERVRLQVSVADSSFIEVNDASVTARITSPTGRVDSLPAEWTVERDGEFAVTFVPTEMGEYDIEVIADRDGAALGSDLTYLTTAPSDEEYFGAGQRTQLLRRIANETGGRYYTAETASSLPEDIEVTGAGVTLVQELDLWDMPALFFLMLVLMGAEWGYRRARGLV